MNGAAVGCLALTVAATATLAFDGDDAAHRVGEAVAMEVSVDLAHFPEAPDAAAQRALLDRAAPILEARMPGVKVTAATSLEGSGAPLLRVDAPASAGLMRPSVIARSTSTGAFRFAPIAVTGDLTPFDTTLELERERFDAWRARAKDASTGAFAGVPRDAGGPHPNLRWMDPPLTPTEPLSDARPLLLTADEAWRFGADDLSRVWESGDDRGFPALGFEIREDRRAAFRAMTEHYMSRQVAVAVGDRILMAPTVAAPLESGGVVTGGAEGFTEARVEDLIMLLRHPIDGVPLRADIVPLEGR